MDGMDGKEIGNETPNDLVCSRLLLLLNWRIVSLNYTQEENSISMYLKVMKIDSLDLSVPCSCLPTTESGSGSFQVHLFPNWGIRAIAGDT